MLEIIMPLGEPGIKQGLGLWGRRLCWLLGIDDMAKATNYLSAIRDSTNWWERTYRSYSEWIFGFWTSLLIPSSSTCTSCALQPKALVKGASENASKPSRSLTFFTQAPVH